jgi:hypothetical protein
MRDNDEYHVAFTHTWLDIVLMRGEFSLFSVPIDWPECYRDYRE